MVRTVVNNQHKGPDPGEVCSPGEHHECDCGVVVDEHLPEVLAFNIEELGDGEGPVEGQLHHVVHPDISVHLVVRVVVPAVPDIPEPGFTPEAEEPVDKDTRVEHPSPSCLAELLECVWQICLATLSHPSLNLNISEPCCGNQLKCLFL